jgi:hypothetical protein
MEPDFLSWLEQEHEKYIQDLLIERFAEQYRVPGPYAVHRPSHGKVYLDQSEYDLQMACADARWICPACGRQSQWDDDNYDEWMEKEHRGTS